MKLKIKHLISAGILVAIAALFIYYLSKNLSDFKQLFSIPLANLWLILVVVLILLLNFFITGMLNNELMKPFGISLKRREYFGLSIISNFYNTITPFRGGMAARAVYLKQKYKFAYVNFFATLAGIYVLTFFIAGIAGLISVLFLWFNYGLFNLLVFYLFLAISLFMLIVIILSPKFKEPRSKWFGRFIKVINGWHLIKNNRKIVFTTSIVALIQLFLGALNILVLYLIFNIHIGFFKALFIASLGSIAILVAVTPGNFGIADAINVFSATIISVGLTEAVAATVLGRVISLLLIFILGPIFSYILLKNKPPKENKNEEHNKK
jgi:uncharacterized protein (TIRG00374 family)